jgi:hypothetical protein
MKDNLYKNAEVNDFVKIINTYKKEVTKSQKSSKRFLIELGVISEDDKPTENYKHLCIPENPA